MCYASGTWTPSKEHERMTQSTQRKMFRLIIQTKRRNKKIVKQKDKTNEEKDTNDMSGTGDESEDGQSSNTHKDQTRRVFRERYWGRNWHHRDWRGGFHWIHKKKHKRCHGKDGKCEDSMLEQDSQKKKWRLALRFSNITQWEMVDESCRMKPRTQLKIQDQQSDWDAVKKMGRWHQRFPQTCWGWDRKLYWKQQPNQQNMDQHSKRPRKMDSTRRKIHNDSRRTTWK